MTTDELSAESRQRVSTAVEGWKRQLLDVSKANRALYYRTQKTTTLPLDAAADDVWARLTERTGEIRVREPHFDEADNPRPKRPMSLVKGLMERARIASEEQGAQILYVAVAWLTWQDDQDPSTVRSPLVLIPVTLTQNQPGTGVIRSVENDDAEVNPTLAEFMRATFGIRLPSIDDFEDDDRRSSLDALLVAVSAAVAPRSDWSIERSQPVLDVFSFRKVAMVQELERTRDDIATNSLIRALARDDSVIGELRPLPAFADLDEDVPPRTMHLVTSADSSQLRVVAGAQRGTSMVVQGPPGTGKSQTITNLIGEFLAEGKTILFVAEKAVAREVVLEKLESAGLGPACLHVAVEGATSGRSNAAGKESVLASLVAAYEQGPGVYPADDLVPSRLEDARRQLTELANATHARCGLGGWTSAFGVVGRAAQLGSEATAINAVPNLDTVDAEWLRRTVESVARLADHPQWIDALRASPWIGLATNVTDQQIEDVLAAAQTLTTLGARVHAASEGANLKSPQLDTSTLEEVGHLATELRQASQLGRLRSSPLRWFRPGFYRARRSAEALRSRWNWSPQENDGRFGDDLRRVIGEAQRAAELLVRAMPGLNRSGGLADLAAALTPFVEHEREAADVVAGRRAIAELPDAVRTVVEALIGEGVQADRLSQAFQARLWGTWASRLVAALPDLAPAARVRLQDNFRDADKEYQRWSKLTALNGAYARRPNPNEPVSPTQGLGKLLRVAKAKRRPSLRRIFSEAPESILRLKPCLLMSPLAVAQYLGGTAGDRYRFDVCIVDEASIDPNGRPRSGRVSLLAASRHG